jgi:hypothetical protein
MIAETGFQIPNNPSHFWLPFLFKNAVKIIAHFYAKVNAIDSHFN